MLFLGAFHRGPYSVEGVSHYLGERFRVKLGVEDQDVKGAAYPLGEGLAVHPSVHPAFHP